MNNIITLLCNIFYKKDCNCEGEINQCKIDKKYMSETIAGLSASLAESLEHVKFTVEPIKEIYPYYVINDCIIADAKYCTFNIVGWRTILNQVYNEINNNVKYTSSIFDCDNFALLFSSILSYSAFKSGLKLQPAFAIAWSNSHAYNLFIDDTNEIYIFEPQTGNIMTWDDANTQDMYKTSKVWFMS